MNKEAHAQNIFYAMHTHYIMEIFACLGFWAASLCTALHNAIRYCRLSWHFLLIFSAHSSFNLFVPSLSSWKWFQISCVYFALAYTYICSLHEHVHYLCDLNIFRWINISFVLFLSALVDFLVSSAISLWQWGIMLFFPR